MKRRTRSIITSALAILIIAAGVVLVSWITSWQSLAVTAVRISGIDEDRLEVLHAAVMESLQGKYLGIFSRSSTLIYPRGTIEEMVSQDFPEVRSVSVERDGRHAIDVTVIEKKPAALICATLPDFNGNELSLEDPGSCYFADESGFIYKKAPSFSGNAYHRFYVPDLAVPAAASSLDDPLLGTFATSTAEFRLLQDFYAGATKAGLAIDALLIKGAGEYELYGRNPSHSTVVIYFNTATDVSEALANLASFWDHAIENARTTGEKPEFDYIDVRYGDNVFYREMK